LYYGLSLANVLVYSNSWFSYTGESEALRMFSIMPDSHSFGLIAVLLIAFTLPLIYYHVRKSSDTDEPQFEVSKLKWYDLWSVVRFSGLALILSGTRAVWVGMLFPFAVAAFAYARNFFRLHMRQQMIGYAMIVILFVLSPFINQVLNTFRAGVFQEEFLSRAKSIYDLGESSNIGRLLIWNESLQYAMHHPLGTGYGNFVLTLVNTETRSNDFSDTASEVNKRYNLPQKYVSAHNIYLQFLVELGAVGVLLFLVWWGVYFKTVWQWLKTITKSRTVAVSFVITFSFTMLWLLAYGLFDVTFFNDKIWIYSNVGLAVVAGIIRSQTEKAA
jgi:O-antigen ligase